MATTNPSSSSPAKIALRIVVVRPPAGVAFRLQQGRSDLIPPARQTPDAIEFEFTLRLGPPRHGHPNFLGPAAQGPPDGRFVYINSGRRAGQQGTGWDRRAKVPLRGITTALLEAALEDRGPMLEARIAGTGPDDGPACGTVPLIEGWRLATNHRSRP